MIQKAGSPFQSVVSFVSIAFFRGLFLPHNHLGTSTYLYHRPFFVNNSEFIHAKLLLPYLLPLHLVHCKDPTYITKACSNNNNNRFPLQVLFQNTKLQNKLTRACPCTDQQCIRGIIKNTREKTTLPHRESNPGRCEDVTECLTTTPWGMT